MNRRSLTISAALLAVVIVAFGIFVFLDRDGGSGSAPITGPGRASEARGIIAEIEERRGSEASRPAVTREPELLERPAATTAAASSTASTASTARSAQTAQTGQQVGGGAVAVTPAPAPAAPTGADAALDESFEQAMALQAEGKLDDAQLLYFYAARQGHARSAFRYAEMNDPLHHSEGSSLLPEPDPNAAFKYYQIALAGGLEDAAERLDALHQWTIDAAAAGNVEAEMLLVQWDK